MENLYKPEKNKENRVEQSQTLFDRVQNKEVDFAEFFEAITGEKFEAWGKKRTHSFEQTA